MTSEPDLEARIAVRFGLASEERRHDRDALLAREQELAEHLAEVLSRPPRPVQV